MKTIWFRRVLLLAGLVLIGYGLVESWPWSPLAYIVFGTLLGTIAVMWPAI